ncbi:MAG TPA: Gfo/Idh/MocA family oxidoreductase [Sumerlaeia bacterium]|nr:Gfo/Idh/MocA family oxidoreductase [Sumerlaeia bacterium]
MTKKRSVRIGFIGVGGMGQCAHLRNYAVLEDCEVVAVAELKAQLRALAAQRYGVANVYESYDDMLNREEVDGIVCSQPFNRHGVLVKDIAKYRLPIFTEKPLAASVAVGEEIVQALEKSNCKHMVGYHKRSDPAVEYAKREVDRLKACGELGDMRYVRILMPAGDWIAGGFDGLLRTGDPAPELERDPPPSDMDEETFGKYAGFVNYYIHQVNLMRYFLGEPYEVTHADPSGVLLVGRSASGVPCTIEMSPDETSVDWQESALVAFQRGYVKVELPAPMACNRAGRVEILRDPGDRTPEVTVPHLPWVHAMKNQASNFLEFVRATAPAPCEAAEALEDLKVAREYIRLLTGR